ncbi:MAG: TetR/AcrR family transcriptional regulator [Bacteroidota bacterium]
MPGKRATPEIRKNQIIAAADLVLLEAGIDAFTIDQVIAKAGIAKGTVYNYYKNKDQILAELGVKAIKLMYEYFEEHIGKHVHSVDKIKALCLACYQFNKHYPQYFELISYMERPEFDINTTGYLKLSQGLQHFTEQLIQEGQAKKELRPNLDAATTHYIIWACCVGVVEFVDTKKRLLANHHEIDQEQMVKTFAEILTVGMAV